MEKTNAVSQKLRDALLPRGPRGVAEPEKELRFTRARQAGVFYGLAAMILTTGITLVALLVQNWGLLALLRVWWWLGLLGLLACFCMLRIALRCTRHAYIILSPLGVEIFPFFKPGQNLQLIYWSQVSKAEVVDDKLVLHFADAKEGGVIASLQPVPAEQRKLLAQALAGVMEKREAMVD